MNCGLNCAKSAADVITVIFGSRKLNVPFTADSFEFATLVAAQSGIEPEHQMIIHKGKRLILSKGQQHNIPPNAKVMLRKLPPVAYSVKGTTALQISDDLKRLREFEKQCTLMSTEFAELGSQIEKHVRGFLDKDLTEQALSKDEKGLFSLDERIMKSLEQIDGLIMSDCGSGERKTVEMETWKTERKSIVVKLQALLTRIDSKKDVIKQYKDDVYDEIEKRRGNV